MSNCHKNIFKVSEKECLECIQKYNKNININNVYGGNRPIYRVTDYGHYKCVELLLKNGAMHKKDNYSMTPLQLHLNSKFGWDDCIILLLQNGYNSGFTQEELKQYVKPVYVENINQYDWQTETLFYLINSKLNFNLTCSVIELLFYGILSFI